MSLGIAQSRSHKRQKLAGAVFALFAVLLSGCASSAIVDEFAVTKDLDEEYLHSQVEQVIAECMRAEGFDYAPRVFVPVNGTSNDFPLLRGSTDGDWQAYGAALSTLRGAADFVKSPEPPTMEFHEALIGARPELGVDGDSPVIRGCIGEGVIERRALTRDLSIGDIDEDGLQLGRAAQLLLADPDYLDFEREWAQCMRENGFAEFEGGRLAFAAQWGLDSPDFAERLAELMSDGGDFTRKLKDLAVIDESAFDEILATDSRLEEIYRLELNAYSADSQCVETHYSIVADAIDNVIQVSR